MNIERAAAAYDIKVRHDLRLYEAFYLEGNTRVRRFLLTEAAAPVADRWAALHGDGAAFAGIGGG